MIRIFFQTLITTIVAAIECRALDNDIDDLIVQLRDFQIKNVSQKQLNQLVKDGKALYTGATKRAPETRAKEHERDPEKPNDFTMYVAKTANIKKAEQKLIDGAHGQPNNINKARKSGVPEIPGSVYVLAASGA